MGLNLWGFSPQRSRTSTTGSASETGTSTSTRNTTSTRTTAPAPVDSFESTARTNTTATKPESTGTTATKTEAPATQPRSLLGRIADGAKKFFGNVVEGAKDWFKKVLNLDQGVVKDPGKPDVVPGGGTARVPNDPEDLKDRNGIPWVSQLKPTGADERYENGAVNCGPASLAMEARRRGYGKDLTDAQLIAKLAEVGKTKPVTGTSLNGIAAMAKEIGVPVDKTEVKYPGFDAAWIDTQLEAGKDVIANGALETPEGPSGHYLLVVGKDAKGDYKVNDPWDSEKKRMTKDELGTFFARNPVHGGAAVALG